MQNTGLDIKKILKRESSFIISDMIKNNRISLSGYFNELSANLIYLNYSDPDFRERNDIYKWRTIRKLSNIDANLNIISVYEIDGSLHINSESIPSEKKLNDFKIVTREPNIYGTLFVEYKMKNLLQKIKKDEQMLCISYQVYGVGVTR